MTEKKLKILHLVQRYHPDVGGMEEVVKQVSENLAIFGHEVHVASSMSQGNITRNEIYNGVSVHRFDISGNNVLGIKGEKTLFKDFLKSADYDVIAVFAAQQWACDLFLEEIESVKCATVFVPTGFSGLKNPLYENYFKTLAKKVKHFNSTILHSKSYQDYKFCLEHEASNMVIIPNGACEAEFHSSEYNVQNIKNLGIINNDYVVISIGNHTGLKGHDEAIKIFKKSSLPSNSKLYIVGKSFFPNPCIIKCKLKAWFNNLLSSKKIYILDLERSCLIDLLKRADIMLFPSNIECAPIVISEALLAKTYYLASDVGNIKEMNEQYGGGKILPVYPASSGYASVNIAECAKVLEDSYKNKLSIEKKLVDQNPLVKDLSWSSISKLYLATYFAAMNRKKLK